jgi:hypothetical protein
MRTSIVAGLAFLSLAGIASAETRNVTGFTAISAADRIRVEVTVGPSYRVEVAGADARRVTTRVDNGKLIIRRSNRSFWGDTPLIDATVRVTMPSIQDLSSSRGAELTATGINTRNISLSAAMGGELRASGACTTVDASASMGGSIDAEALQCRDADVSASMGGEARVHASNRFEVSASMGGAVNVAGEGRASDVSLSMGGTLDQN